MGLKIKIRSTSEVTKFRPEGSAYTNFFGNFIVRSFTKVKQKAVILLAELCRK